LKNQINLTKGSISGRYKKVSNSIQIAEKFSVPDRRRQDPGCAAMRLDVAKKLLVVYGRTGIKKDAGTGQHPQ
jgi:hypothetical protein